MADKIDPHASAAQPEDDGAQPDLVIITGMSGAGRTEAMHTFEDLGFFCIDNLPPSLLVSLVTSDSIPGAAADGRRRLAVVCDARNRSYFRELAHELSKLKDNGITYRIIFMDAADDALLARYKASRRRHPMCTDNHMTIAQGIRKERAMLSELREIANMVIDTTNLRPIELRRTIAHAFEGGSAQDGLGVVVYSFGFKHGAATDADIVIDVRFLPNPYYDPELRHLTGLDAPVRDFVMGPPRNPGVHEALEGPARLRDARLRGGRQAAARDRGGLHGRPAPQRGDRRGYGGLPEEPGLPRAREPSRPVPRRHRKASRRRPVA